MLKIAYQIGYNEAIKEAGATHGLLGAALGAGLGVGAGHMLDLDSPSELAMLGGLGALGGGGAGLYAAFKQGTSPAARAAAAAGVDDAIRELNQIVASKPG